MRSWLLRRKLKVSQHTSRGFTLIELVIVFSLISLLSFSGIAAFNTFNRSQILNGAANEIVSSLTVAKSRAQSQVKDSRCSDTDTLSYWYIQIINTTTYQLAVQCIPNAFSSKVITLPKGLSFTSGQQLAFYHILDGGVLYYVEPYWTAVPNLTIMLSDGSKTKSVLLDQYGNIRVQ